MNVVEEVELDELHPLIYVQWSGCPGAELDCSIDLDDLDIVLDHLDTVVGCLRRAANCVSAWVTRSGMRADEDEWHTRSCTRNDD